MKKNIEIIIEDNCELKITVRKPNGDDTIAITIEPDDEKEYICKKCDYRMVDGDYDEYYEDFMSDDLIDAVYSVKVMSLAEKWFDLFVWEFTEEEDSMFVRDCLDEDVCPKDVIMCMESMIDLDLD